MIQSVRKQKATNPLFYVMNEGKVIEAVFKMPDEEMNRHLKHLYMWAKVEDVGINKVLIDGGAAINLMVSILLSKLGKSTSDLKPHNMVLPDFGGKISKALGVILLNVHVGTNQRPILFVVVPSKANYNLLLGRE